MTLPLTSSDPIDAVNGDMYYSTTENKVKIYQNGAWTYLPSANDSAIQVINKFQITSPQLSSKSVTLSGTPSNPANTILNIIGGPVQDYGSDFTIVGNTLTWNGYALDGILELDDKLIVQFD